ncbi:MAG: hypothetical protein ACLFQ0_19210 [Cyclobacteriaceae bacterium]
MCISGLYGCQEDDLSIVYSYTSHTKGELVTKVPNVNKVKVHNGYLWFADTMAYKMTLEKLQNYSREELDEWEKELGFTSIRYLFEKAVDEDEKYFKELESMTDEEEIKKHQSVAPSPHSAYVLNNSELFKFHDEGWFEIKIPL